MENGQLKLEIETLQKRLRNKRNVLALLAGLTLAACFIYGLHQSQDDIVGTLENAVTVAAGIGIPVAFIVAGADLVRWAVCVLVQWQQHVKSKESDFQSSAHSSASGGSSQYTESIATRFRLHR